VDVAGAAGGGGGSIEGGGRTWVTSPSSSSYDIAGSGVVPDWDCGSGCAVPVRGAVDGSGVASGGAGFRGPVGDGGSGNDQLDSDTAHLSIGDPVETIIVRAGGPGNVETTTILAGDNPLRG